MRQRQPGEQAWKMWGGSFCRMHAWLANPNCERCAPGGGGPEPFPQQLQAERLHPAAGPGAAAERRVAVACGHEPRGKDHGRRAHPRVRGAALRAKTGCKGSTLLPCRPSSDSVLLLAVAVARALQNATMHWKMILVRFCSPRCTSLQSTLSLILCIWNPGLPTTVP